MKSSSNSLQYHIVWVNTDPFEGLDIATWLYTTRELRLQGWKVTLIAPDTPGIHEKLGVAYFGIPMPKVYLVRQFIYHLRVLAYLISLPEPPDVILMHEMSIPVFFPLRVLRKLVGRKLPLYVLDIRSLPMQPAEISSWKDRLREVYFYAAVWLANRCAVDGQVTITKPMAKALRIPEKKLWGVWTSGVHIEPFASASRTRLWQDVRNQVKLIYIGSMDDGRNVALFGKAVIVANQQGMNFTMTYIGEGAEMPDLLLLSKEHGDWIRVHPPIPHQQVPNWLANAHVGILPFPNELKFRVSSPIKLFEYMASGLAILATRIECHTNVIDTDGYVFWAEESTQESFLETLRQVWERRETLPEMGKRAASASSRWTWAESARCLSEALRKGLELYD